MRARTARCATACAARRPTHGLPPRVASRFATPADRHRPGEEPPRVGRAAGDLAPYLPLELVEEQRDAAHDGRAYLDHVGSPALHRPICEDHRGPRVQAGQHVGSALEHVAQRQDREDHVGSGDGDRLRRRQRAVHHVAVRQHRSPRLPVLGHGVHDRGQAGRLDGERLCLPMSGRLRCRRRGVGEGGQGRPGSFADGQRVDSHHRHDWKRPRPAPQPVEKVVVLDDQQPRRQVAELRGDAGRRLARLDRAGDGSEREGGEVGDHPFRARSAQDDDPIALHDPEAAQHQRGGTDLLPQLGVGPAGPPGDDGRSVCGSAPPAERLMLRPAPCAAQHHLEQVPRPLGRWHVERLPDDPRPDHGLGSPAGSAA